MSDDETPESELSKAQRWRIEQLQAVGMDEWKAVTLALASPTSWSEARKLIEDGCSPSLAFDIVR